MSDFPGTNSPVEAEPNRSSRDTPYSRQRARIASRLSATTSIVACSRCVSLGEIVADWRNR